MPVFACLRSINALPVFACCLCLVNACLCMPACPCLLVDQSRMRVDPRCVSFPPLQSVMVHVQAGGGATELTPRCGGAPLPALVPGTETTTQLVLTLARKQRRRDGKQRRSRSVEKARTWPDRAMYYGMWPRAILRAAFWRSRTNPPAKRCHYTAINSAPRSSRSRSCWLVCWCSRSSSESTIGTKTRTQLVSECRKSKSGWYHVN